MRTIKTLLTKRKRVARRTHSLLLLSSKCALMGQEQSIEERTGVHRLSTNKRSVYDAFAYLNRLPEMAEKGESVTEYAGRIFGRLANQEGRILLKAPPGMDREAYLGFKTFMRYEGEASVGNCAACHTPADFTDDKTHVVSQGADAKRTPSLRNLSGRGIDLRNALLEKIAASRQKRSVDASEIDDAYGAMRISEEDIPGLMAFLKLLDDVPDDEFRNLILAAKVIDPTVAEDVGLEGVVTFDGPRPDREPIQMQDREGKQCDCHKLHEKGPLEETLIVGENNGIANVFVYVKKGYERKEYPAPEKPAVLDQVGCMFRPRIQGVMVGQELVMKNGDPVLHNVRAMSFRNRPFNIAQPANSPDRTKAFTRKEKAVTIACDLHPWMKAVVFVMDHPWFAVTNEKGQFRIVDLPPGEYTLAAWHEELGERDVEVTVPSHGTANVEFSFKPKKSTVIKAKSTTVIASPAGDGESALRAFVQEWKPSDLTIDASTLKGRSIENGQRVFNAAGCIKCHAVGGQGAKFGTGPKRGSQTLPGSKAAAADPPAIQRNSQRLPDSDVPYCGRNSCVGTGRERYPRCDSRASESAETR